MTRSGDQAWDFAVPLVLIEMFDSNMRIAFVYFFVVKLTSVIVMPYIGRVIDHVPRKKSIQLGIGLQLFSVIISAGILYFLNNIGEKNLNTNNGSLLGYVILIVMGFFSSIGSSIMDISVASDLVPSAISKEKLPYFNSRLRQLDLFTEVTSPILAGLLLLIHIPEFYFLGFSLIVLWNVLSFYPEYTLLNQILGQRPDLNAKKIVSKAVKETLIKKMQLGWATFSQQPVALVVLSYAILWLSVLSPHGVLLTAFLKGGWSVPEPVIGSFRALGAVFGITATLLFPKVHKRFGLLKAGKLFISFQAFMVILSFISFYIGTPITQSLFLLFILFSRIGLYGFSLSETEIRQTNIPEQLRGEINGVATSLTGLASLLIFGLGVLFSTAETFSYLVLISTIAVVLAATIFNTLAFRKLSN